jgi:nucleotide-binding universal stress UspA family protein
MFSRIVVAVAKSETARRAAEVAADLATRYGADLHLVMAFRRGEDDRASAESFLEACARQAPPGAQTHALPGDPAEAVLMVAEEVRADLIVVGNRGMKGARRVLGSVPNSIAHGAACSVLIADTTS